MCYPSVNPLLEVSLLAWVQFSRASCHDVTVPGNRVSHVEVVDSISKHSVVNLFLAVGGLRKVGEAVWLDIVIFNKVRSKLSESCSHFI